MQTLLISWHTINCYGFQLHSSRYAFSKCGSSLDSISPFLRPPSSSRCLAFGSLLPVLLPLSGLFFPFEIRQWWFTFSLLLSHNLKPCLPPSNSFSPTFQLLLSHLSFLLQLSSGRTFWVFSCFPWPFGLAFPMCMSIQLQPCALHLSLHWSAWSCLRSCGLFDHVLRGLALTCLDGRLKPRELDTLQRKKQQHSSESPDPSPWPLKQFCAFAAWCLRSRGQKWNVRRAFQTMNVAWH